jgi:hypothetical protein
MGKYLELIDRALPQDGECDISDQSDNSPPQPTQVEPFGRLCRFGRSPEPANSTATWDETHDERAAIAEFDGGAPRAWAEALARLDPNKPPRHVTLERWWRFIDDCGRFLDGGWAQRAEALGWGPLQLFGCNRKRLHYVPDRGLLWEINGGRLIVLYRDGAIIETLRGDRLRYRRQPPKVGQVVPAWRLS